MKRISLLLAAAALLALTACNDNTPAPSYAQPPVVNQQDTPSVAQAVPQQDTTFRDAALGAAGGYLLGRVLHGGGTSNNSGYSSAPTVVHNNTTVVKKTIVQNNNVRQNNIVQQKAVPKPQPSRSVISRPSFSGSKRR